MTAIDASCVARADPHDCVWARRAAHCKSGAGRQTVELIERMARAVALIP